MSQIAPSSLPVHSAQVLTADALYCIFGVNIGDSLDCAETVCAGDIYALDPDVAPQRISLTRISTGTQTIGTGSDVGQSGDVVTFELRYTLMANDGEKVEILLLSLQTGARFILPLSPMTALADYTMLMVEDAPEDVGLSDLLCISFARGTMITVASGEQRPIESLVAGDKLLTRDHGAQELRYIGKTTVRAIGAFAPVLITAGTLGNSGDLIVSQHHRMFLYQRKRKAGQPTAELLVQAKHLIDNERVFMREGGFVDYFSLIFDRHEIVYAEGIPAESLMVTDATVSRLPAELSEDLRARFPGLSQNQHFGTEAGRAFLEEIGAGTLFKAPSRTPAKPER